MKNTKTITQIMDPSGTPVRFEHNHDTAWVLETPKGFVSTLGRVLVFMDLGAAFDVATEHDGEGGVLFWQGTLDSWRESAKEAGVPIILVGP